MPGGKASPETCGAPSEFRTCGDGPTSFEIRDRDVCIEVPLPSELQVLPEEATNMLGNRGHLTDIEMISRQPYFLETT